MASFEAKISESIVENGIKRKNDAIIEKVKKKKKKKVTETVEANKQTIEVIEKVKKKKNHVEIIKTKSDDEIAKKTHAITENTKNNFKAKTKKVRHLPTVTIAVPGSILDNAQSPEFRTYLAGQIARAACIYKIDEVCHFWF